MQRFGWICCESLKEQQFVLPMRIKQNNLSLVICVVISLSLGWRKDHLSLQGKGDPSSTPNEGILPYSTPDEGYFVFYILLFNGFKSFQAKKYEINMYLSLYFMFFNHSVGIHPTATQKSHEQHFNAIHMTS